MWGRWGLLSETGDGDRLVMAYLWMRPRDSELGRYEGYYGVFRDYGADEGMLHYKSFLIMQRFVAENLPPFNSIVL